MRKRIISVLIVLATILLLAWWFGWIGEDKALADVKALQDELANPNLSEADFRAKMDQVRGLMVSLPENSRRAAWENGRDVFERREQSRINRILGLKGQERTKALDEEINRSERRRNEWQQRQNQAQASAQRGGQQSPRGPGGPRNRGGQSDEQRISRLRNRLDRSTPEQRASRAEFARLINERRTQRGLPPMQRGRG
jgi:hypothetical protein